MGSQPVNRNVEGCGYIILLVCVCTHKLFSARPDALSRFYMSDYLHINCSTTKKCYFDFKLAKKVSWFPHWVLGNLVALMIYFQVEYS